MINDDNQLEDRRKLQLWRGGKRARLGLGIISVDAYACLPIFLLIIKKSWLIVGLIVFTIAMFYLLEIFKYPFPVAVRRILGMFAGKRRYIRNVRLRHRRFSSGH